MNSSFFTVMLRSAFLTIAVLALGNPAWAQSSNDPMEKQIAKVQSELAEIADSLNPRKTINSDEKAIRILVRRAFEMQIRLQEMRIAKAEADLKQVKQQLSARKRAADSIIADRVADLSNRLRPNGEDDTPASILSAEGWKAWKNQDWRTALSKFKASIAKDATDANTLNGLGWTYLHLGEHEKSIEVFKQARKIEPNHGGVLNGLGQNLMTLGKLEEAKAILVQTVNNVNQQMGEAIAIKRGITASWFALAQLHMKMKNPNDAIKLAERYLKHKPDDAIMKKVLDEAQSMKPN